MFDAVYRSDRDQLVETLLQAERGEIAPEQHVGNRADDLADVRQKSVAIPFEMEGEIRQTDRRKHRESKIARYLVRAPGSRFMTLAVGIRVRTRRLAGCWGRWARV